MYSANPSRHLPRVPILDADETEQRGCRSHGRDRPLDIFVNTHQQDTPAKPDDAGLVIAGLSPQASQASSGTSFDGIVRSVDNFRL